MEKYINIGIELFLKEYNCAQSVFGALSEKLNFNEEDAIAIAAPFGGGIARSRKTCGALIGGLMAIGYANRELDKASMYKLAREYMDEFEAKLGTTECDALLGYIEDKSITPSPRTAKYYEERPCVHIVSLAIELAKKYL